MKIGYLVFNLDGMGGTSRSAVTQANALAGDHDVTLLSVTRSGERPHYEIDDRIRVRYLVDVREGQDPSVPGVELPPSQARALHERESLLVPERWDGQFTALCDVGLEHVLPGVKLDVLVTVTPGLLAAAIQLLPPEPVVVHQEHRSTSDRSSGLDPLLNFAPRADVVAVFTPAMADWVREQLGDSTPEIAIVPNPLPLGFTPRSRLDNPLVMTAGRLVNEKQFPRLIEAFAQVSDQLPEWRLRIYGTGPKRQELLRHVRKLGMFDRVELPGAVADMRGEWAKASICALTSRAEGFPLVVQEAMAAGVPVASYDCASGPREIIEHEVNGLLVSPESIAGMASALLRLATDVDLRRALGEGAYRTSRQYDAYAIAERWVGIFSAARTRRTVAGRLTPRVTALADAKPVPTAAADAVAATGVTPAQAREETLGWAVRAATASSDHWLVIPAHESGAPVVVVPMADRDAFLKELGDTGAPAYLSLRDPDEYGWPERRGTIARLGEELRRGMTPRLFVEPWPVVDEQPQLVGQGCSVEVQFWERHPDGALVSPRPNRYTNRIPAGEQLVPLEIDGVAVRTLPLMADADGQRVPVPRRRRLHVGRRRRPRVGRRARGPDLRHGGHRPDPRGERPGAVHLARRAALLPAVGAPVRALGPQHLRRDERPGAGLARARPPRRDGRAARRDHAGRRAARPSTRTRSRPRCTTSPGWPSTGSTSTTTSSSAGRCGPRRCSARPACRRCSSRGRRSGSATCRTPRPGSRPRGTTAACSSTPSARSRPTRWPTRRTPSAPRCSARSSSGSPTWSARPRTHRSGPTPTSRR